MKINSHGSVTVVIKVCSRIEETVFTTRRHSRGGEWQAVGTLPMVVEADAQGYTHGYAPEGVSSFDTPGPMGASSVSVGADGPTTLSHRPWTTMDEPPDGERIFGRVPSGGSSHEIVNDFIEAEAVKEEAASSNASLRDLLQAMRSGDRQDAVRDFQEKEGWKEGKRDLEEKIARLTDEKVIPPNPHPATSLSPPA